LCLLEKVANPGRADADEHLHKVRAGNGVERHSGFTSDCPSEQRLAGAWLAVQQDALGNLGADRLELARLGEELLDLLQLLDRLLAAGDVAEGRLRRVFVADLGFRLAKLYDSAAAALHGVQQKEEQHADDDEGDEGAKQGVEKRR